MTSDKAKANNNSGADFEFETQFVPQDNDDEILYAVEEITAERGNKYKVKWSGVNPATGKPWPQDWVNKRDCTDDLVAEWKAKKAQGRATASKKRGSGSRSITKSRMSTSTSRASSTRITRQANRAGFTPRTPSDEERSTHVPPPPVNKPPLTKRKRRSDSPELSPDEGKLEGRHESPRPRKKQKRSPTVIVAVPSTKLTASAKELDSGSDNDTSGSEKGPAGIKQVKIGPPRGVKRQVSSGKDKSKIQEPSMKIPDPHSKTLHCTSRDDGTSQRGNLSSTLPTPKPRPKPRVIVKKAQLPRRSPCPASHMVPSALPKSTNREPILSPRALARLELFDRMMEEPCDALVDHDFGDPPPTSPVPLKRTMSKSRPGVPESQSTNQLPQGSQPGQSSPLSGSPKPQVANKNGKGSMKELTKLDFPEIAVMPVSASSTVSPINELSSTVKLPLPITRLIGNSPRPHDRQYLTPSKTGYRNKPGKANMAEPLPSSIESFDSPRSRVAVSGALKTGRSKGKEKERPIDEQDSVSDHEVEHDDDPEHEDVEEEEDISHKLGQKTDSELRKRGQELFDEQQRKREANSVAGPKPPKKNLAIRCAQKTPVNYISKPKKFLASAACKKTAFNGFKHISENGRVVGGGGGIPYRDASDEPNGNNGEAAGTDALESAVQEMEVAYVDLSGGTRTQSGILETQSLNRTPRDIEVLRIILREEEEEDTQEAMYGIALVAQDQVSQMIDDAVEGDVMPNSVDADPVESRQVQSQDAPERSSTRTEDLQLASVIVQASQGQQQLDMDDIRIRQAPLPGSRDVRSPPRDSQRSVLDTPKRHLGEALSLLNVKSEEIQRLERELAHERQSSETTRAELTKVAQECEALHSSVAEERSRLNAERTGLEERRKRWSEDRVMWVEEVERWKHAHDVWEEQRRELSKEHSKPPDHVTSLSGDSMMTPPAEKLQDPDMVTSSAMATWASEREVLTKERDELSRKVTELGASVDAVAAAKLSAEKDRDFFREQYAQASSYVSSVRGENVELEGRVAIAESQAKEGVAAIKALFEAKVKALQDDVHRWKMLAEILQMKDSRTNDDVRMRAAQAAELEAFCKKLLQENDSLQTDLRKLGRAQQRVSVHRNKLQRRVVSLVKDKASLKMKLAKCCTSQDSSHSQAPDQSMSFQEESESWDPNDMDIIPGSQVPPPEESSYEDPSWFPCMWRHKTMLCSRMFDSKEDLVRHMSEHV